jgi:hypothetical protein
LPPHNGAPLPSCRFRCSRDRSAVGLRQPRADVDAGLHAVTDFELLGLLDERGDVLVVDASSTITRLVAVHFWPVEKNDALTTLATAG